MRKIRKAGYSPHMKRKIFIASAGIALLLGVVATVWMSGILTSRKHVETVKVDGLTIPANVGSRYLQVYHNGTPQDILLKGVNMGIAKPGHFPGEAAISKDEYLRWFQQIGDMHANVLRIYTLHPPAFYEALEAYNKKAANPLYVLHGIWMNEDKLIASEDVFADENTQDFAEETRRTIDVIHGNAKIPVRPGHASGSYTADISEYVLGWIIGVEWDPEVVISTNAKHANAPDFQGTYFRTEKASPFESWIAEAMDDTVKYETETYTWQRPISFTNWVTTDLLKHPAEPSEKEDAVSINPNVIWPTSSLKAGYFASYHVYPYYPDFLNYETKYTDYIDHRGQKNNYAGYLRELKQAHRMPVVVAEFGVPSSRGMTHRNVSGWNQGFLSEEEQGDIDSRLFEDIYQEGMAGGLVFSWQDEWFKRTWNNMDYDNPDRRPFWSNVQTSEQYFGLMGFDPGASELLVKVDGKTNDWEKAGIKPFAVGGKTGASALQKYNDGYDEQRQVDRLYMASDERYVYFRLDFGKSDKPLDWTRTNATIMLDTVPGQGQTKLPGGVLTSDAGFDFAIDVKGPNTSRIWIDSYYDLHELQYGRMLNMIPQTAFADKKNNGVFHKQMLTLNKPLTIPNRQGDAAVIPFESYETGLLRFGDGDPDSPQYDSLTDVAVNAKDAIVELRIPWQLLNIKDPSMHEAVGDIREKGLDASVQTPGFHVAVVTYRPEPDEDTTQHLGGDAIADFLPSASNGVLRANDMPFYQWKGWDYPQTHERLKKSYYKLKETFAAVRFPTD
ncbi:hypothetical protein [Paenibacillus roseipurpureus]|uniref:Family 2 glycosyl transferase n=1 Tax=Paenibacillus roseopurpureus TaxID=2918901 RepID=A0AA96LQB9_9BACL|nr:hypothetical protein [Paenibacillus sp. MBLB1832]WNR45372.1 hypothetical protein MJB10_04330 [Paenibacillus sp. MBLB1832]